jgi:hypothetical protein
VATPLARTYFPEFKEDLLALADVNLQRRVLTLWTDVSKGLVTGIPLQNLVSVGDLSDCFKIYFDLRDDGPPRYRFVYRIRHDGIEAVSVEAVAAGERRALRVYVEAARRLGRLTR